MAVASRSSRAQASVPVYAPPRASTEDALRMHLLAKAGRRVGFFDWARRVPEPKAGTLDFRRFPFQLELYQQGAEDKELVVQKCTQVGISAFAVRWALFQTDTKRMTGLYVFPTLKDVYDFSTARIQPVIDGSEYLRSRQRPADPDSKGLRAIGGGFVYFRGSESKRGLDSVDADYVVFDEYDTLTQGNIPDAERRISGSLKGLIRRVGVPSQPDWGINKLYEESDKREWTVKCEACGEWQRLDFFENVDQARAIRVCRRCTKPLDVAAGEWVAEFPDREVRGYHISRLIAPLADIKQIVKASRKRTQYEKKVFFNKDLGLPYAEEEGRLSRQALAAAQREFVQEEAYVGAKLVTMGVDVASVRDLNVRVSEHLNEHEKRGLFIGQVSDFDELCRIMVRFNVKMAVIDHEPDGRLSGAFAERFPGRVYKVSYNVAPRLTADVIKVNEELRHVTVHRTAVIDATFELIRAQRNLLPINLPDDYVDHMQANNRVVETDEFGKQTVVYRATAPDDYAQAETYDVVATEMWWYRQELDEAQRQTFRQLDDMIEFERSGLSTYGGDGEYHAGPSDSMPDEYFGPTEERY